MSRNYFIHIYILISLLSFSRISGQGPVDGNLVNYVEKYCPVSQKEEKIRVIKRIFDKLPKSTRADGIKAAELIIPQVCLLNYPSWLVDRTLNLAIYGVSEKKLKDSTIEYLSEMIPSVSVGKIDLIDYGLLMEKMFDSGIHQEYIVDFFHTALELNITRVRIEALAYYYTKSLRVNKNHNEALKQALSDIEKLSAYGDKTAMLSFVFNTNPDNKIKPGKKTDEEIQLLEKQWDKFWKSQKNKIKVVEKFSKVKVKLTDKEIVSRLKAKAGVPYGYRANRGNAVDATGLISYLTGEKIESLPVRTDTYCTFGSTFSAPHGLKPGDLIFFKNSGKKTDLKAVGMYVDSNEFILVTHARGAEIFTLDEKFFKKYFIKACRILK